MQTMPIVKVRDLGITLAAYTGGGTMPTMPIVKVRDLGVALAAYIMARQESEQSGVWL